MGRPSKSRTLALWANGERVGRWTLPARGPAELEYDPAWVASPLGRPLSLSLPFPLANEPLTGAPVENYFDNLLPDSSAIRRRVALRFRTDSTDPFDLLRAIGRDCVGAIQLLDEDASPVDLDAVHSVPVDEEDIERHLLEVVTPDRFAGWEDSDDDFRISLAGAQEKDAFLWWDGQWRKPRGSTPTTHIFKLPMGLVGGRRADFTTSVDNEWLCLRVLKAFGLPAADASIATFGGQRVLVVERFDRAISRSGKLLRLVQEDFCQATGTSPSLKYESQGGPGLKQLSSILKQSERSDEDMRTLMASQVLFWMLRAPDGHAKNFSIQLLGGGSNRFRMTPLYDVMSAYPVLGDGANQWNSKRLKLAMALTGKTRHYHMQTIERRHFNSTARIIGFGESAETLIEALLERTQAVVDKVGNELPPGFSQQVADRVLNGLLAAADRLRQMPG